MCPPPRNTRQATVFYVSVTCNAVATYTCKDTKLTMVGSGRKICNKGGMWDGAEPQCISKFHFSVSIHYHLTITIQSSDLNVMRYYIITIGSIKNHLLVIIILSSRSLFQIANYVAKSTKLNLCILSFKLLI